MSKIEDINRKIASHTARPARTSARMLPEHVSEVVAGAPVLVEALGVPAYTTDAEGRLTSYNEAAVALWGYRPALRDTRWCGSWRLFNPDGSALRHEDCPMALAIRKRRPIRGREAVAERPDGTRVAFMPFPMPLRNETGTLVGAVNVLVDISACKAAEAALAAKEEQLRRVKNHARMQQIRWGAM